MKLFSIHNYWKLAVFFSIFIISFWRSPFIFTNARFIGEEATHHFVFALEHSFVKNLLYYDDFAGYYNLIPNLLLGVASLIPIELAPYITVYGSFAFIILLPYFCLFRDSHLLDNDKKKLLSAYILFLSPPFVPEVWLNSLNTQIYLCLISILILFMKNLNRSKKTFNHILIFFAGFSGIYSCALLPFFVLRYLKNKQSYNLMNLIILLSANVVQLSLIINSKVNNILHSTVLKNDLNTDLLINYSYNILAKPFFARQFTHFVWDKISNITKDPVIIISFVLSISLLFLILNFNRLIKFFIKDKSLIVLIFIFLTISSVVLIGSLGNYVGGRYAVIPGSILILIFLHFTSNLKSKFIKNFSLVMVMSSLFFGIYEFRPPVSNVSHQYIKFLDCIDCPVWKKEVQKWKLDKSYVIKIWPYPSKSLILKN